MTVLVEHDKLHLLLFQEDLVITKCSEALELDTDVLPLPARSTSSDSIETVFEAVDSLEVLEEGQFEFSLRPTAKLSDEIGSRISQMCMTEAKLSFEVHCKTKQEASWAFKKFEAWHTIVMPPNDDLTDGGENLFSAGQGLISSPEWCQLQDSTRAQRH